MDWRNLAFKNIWRNIRRYLGYLLASTLAITVFCMFMLFVDNPTVQHGYVTRTASEMLIVCQVIVALFAIFFIFYFHAALIRMRNKEFGLLTTLGMTHRQVGWMIFFESLCIAAIALIIGSLLGILCSIPFLAAMGNILGLPSSIPFALSPDALWFTLLFFSIVFVLEAIMISWRVARRTPRMLILGARQRQTMPRASWLLVILGLLCLGTAYDLALQFSIMIILTAIPIVALTIIGTYFLFSQVFVMLLGHLRRRALHGVSLLIVSRLAYRIKDYARMITVVTVLNAVVLTSMGAVYGMMQLTQSNSVHTKPFPLEMAFNEANPPALSVQQIHGELRAQNLSIQSEVTTPFLTGKLTKSSQSLPIVIITPESFRQLRTTLLQAHPELSQYAPPVPAPSTQQGQLFVPFIEMVGKGLSSAHAVQIHVGSETMPLQVAWSAGYAFNRQAGLVPEVMLVVNDQTYTRLNATTPPANHWQMHSFIISDWTHSQQAVNDLRQRLPNAQQGLLTDAVTDNNQVLQLLSVMLFGGFFISCLFFLAAGSALYFKLFTQQEEDNRQFHALERIGLRKKEALRVLNSEFLLLFFIPVAVAILHSSVAIGDLANLVVGFPQASWIAFGVVCLCYAVCFGAYFLVARLNYFKRLRLA